MFQKVVENYVIIVGETKTNLSKTYRNKMHKTIL